MKCVTINYRTYQNNINDLHDPSPLTETFNDRPVFSTFSLFSGEYPIVRGGSSSSAGSTLQVSISMGDWIGIPPIIKKKKLSCTIYLLFCLAIFDI